MAEIDTGTEQLICRIEDGVAVLTLNRPEARNALSMDCLLYTSPSPRDRG